jgi:hypothetical protein
MKNFSKLFGIIALIAVIGFSMAACGSDDDGGGGGGGSISGTWGDGSSHEQTITFTGSNYTFADDDGSVISSGTYTLASDGKDIAYKQTSPTSATYKGYYFPNDDPPCLTADFLGINVTYTKQPGNGGNPQTATYTGTAGGTTYTLVITGDTAYVLTAGQKTSSGTVTAKTGGVVTLKPSNAATTFTATVSGTSLTALNGTITWTDDTTATAPGAMTSGGGGDQRDVLIGIWDKDGASDYEKFDVGKSGTRYAAYFKVGSYGSSQYMFDIATYNGTTVTPSNNSSFRNTFTATIGDDGKLTVSGVPDVPGTAYYDAIVFNGTYTKR